MLKKNRFFDHFIVQCPNHVGVLRKKKSPVVDEAVVHQAAGSFHRFSDTVFEPG